LRVIKPFENLKSEQGLSCGDHHPTVLGGGVQKPTEFCGGNLKNIVPARKKEVCFKVYFSELWEIIANELPKNSAEEKNDDLRRIWSGRPGSNRTTTATVVNLYQIKNKTSIKQRPPHGASKIGSCLRRAGIAH